MPGKESGQESAFRIMWRSIQENPGNNPQLVARSILLYRDALSPHLTDPDELEAFITTIDEGMNVWLRIGIRNLSAFIPKIYKH